MDCQISDLQQKRTQMMLELDKVMEQFEQTEREKVELVRKIQVLQGLEEERVPANFKSDNINMDVGYADNEQYNPYQNEEENESD